MAVQSKALKDGKAEEPRAYRSPTALVAPVAVALMAIRILRVIAFLLIAMSIFGNYVTFIGGWAQLSWAINWSMAIVAIAYQLIFGVLQWGMKALRWWLVYLFALFASAIPSFLTYHAWAGPYLSIHIGALFAFILVGLAAIGADALPEWVLVG